MKFSDTTLEDGLVQEVDRLVHTNSTSYPLKAKTARINARYDDVVSLIMQADGRWKWDDSNYTTLPMGYVDLESGQDDYSVMANGLLTIERVEIMDSNGKYQLITPLDASDVHNQSISEFQGTDGMPRFYDKVGESIILMPKPSGSLCTLASGMRVCFQRGASHFVSTDTTKEPGFLSTCHKMLAVGAALDYAIDEDMTTKINTLTGLWKDYVAQVIAHYGARSKDERPRMTVRRENYGFGGNNGGYAPSDKMAF